MKKTTTNNKISKIGENAHVSLAKRTVFVKINRNEAEPKQKKNTLSLNLNLILFVIYGFRLVFKQKMKRK